MVENQTNIYVGTLVIRSKSDSENAWRDVACMVTDGFTAMYRVMPCIMLCCAYEIFESIN